ncbi:MAG: hypothetical protein ACQEUZ_06360 [Pseudomonadota bacterium]
MFEAGKEYRTRDGRRARVYATDGGGPCPIHGAINKNDRWFAYCWRKDGTDAEQQSLPAIVTPNDDLMPPKREAWVRWENGIITGFTESAEDIGPNARGPWLRMIEADDQ